MERIFIPFCSVPCWGGLWPCQYLPLDVGRNLAGANVGEDVLKITLAAAQASSEARKEETSGARPGCIGQPIVPVLLSWCAREERKITSAFFCASIWNICRRRWGENVLFLFFFHFFPSFSSVQINVRCVVKCYFAAASIPQAGALLAALLVAIHVSTLARRALGARLEAVQVIKV